MLVVQNCCRSRQSVSAADLVRAEAARHNVIPLVDDAILPADAGVADDEENELWCDGTGP